jgi:hypothetical protein
MVFNANHANGYPQIDMAADDSGVHPRLYVTWNDYRNGDVDVFCISSADTGRSWGPAVRVNSDPLHNGADQLFQWLAVDSASGAVNVLFYDRRRDPANRAVEVVLARSTDGARTFPNYLLAIVPMIRWARRNRKNIPALAAIDGRIFGSWMEIVPQPGSVAPGPESPRNSSIIRIGTADFKVPATGKT